MKLILHPQATSDISTIMAYYEKTASTKLADKFYDELRRQMDKAASEPYRFAMRERDLRRVNIDRFPHHFMFRIIDDSVQILVVRHNKRNPRFGINRR